MGNFGKFVEIFLNAKILKWSECVWSFSFTIMSSTLVFNNIALTENILSFLDEGQVFPCSFVSKTLRAACLNREDMEEQMAMFSAIAEGSVSLVKFLVEKLNFPVEERLFDIAAPYGNIEIFDYLYSLECFPEPYHYERLCRSASIKAFDWLLEKGVEPEDSYWLECAIKHNRLDVIRWCKRKKIQVDAKQLAKLALNSGRIRIFEWVLSRYGSELDAETLRKGRK